MKLYQLVVSGIEAGRSLGDVLASGSRTRNDKDKRSKFLLDVAAEFAFSYIDEEVGIALFIENPDGPELAYVVYIVNDDEDRIEVLSSSEFYKRYDQ